MKCTTYGEVAVFSNGTTVVRWNHKPEGEPITIFEPGYFEVQDKDLLPGDTDT